MSARSIPLTRRIAQLLIITQVVFGVWNGQPVSAQTEAPTAEPAIESTTETGLNYSSSHALMLTGEAQEADGKFTIDDHDRLLNYRGTMDEQNHAVDRRFYQAAFDDYSHSNYQRYLSGPDYSNLRSGRYGHTATVLQDGRVLIAGGSNGHRVLRTSVIYDPATNRMTDGPYLIKNRVWHTATLLPDGNVLILGGNTATDADVNAFAGTGQTASGEIYIAKQNQFMSLSDWYGEAGMLWARSHHTTVQLPNTNKVLVVGSAEEAIAAQSATVFKPTTGSISLGCDSPKAGFRSPIYESGTVVRVSCTLANSNVGPNEATELTVDVSVDGDATDWGLRMPRALITLTATGDTMIHVGQRKLLGLFTLNPNVRKTSWSANPFASDYTQHHRSVQILRIANRDDDAGVQTGNLTLTVSFDGERRTYSQPFAGKRISQPETSPSPAHVLSPQRFFVYDYQGSPLYHNVASGPDTFYYGQTIRQLGHSWAYPVYKDLAILQKYAADQPQGLTLYATRWGQITNSLSALNQVANALGARVETEKIIAEELGGSTGNRPDAILISNIDGSEGADASSITDDGDHDWNDAEGLFAEVLDTTTGRSTPLPASLAPSQNASIYPLKNGRAIITGGGLAKVYLFDALANTVTVVGELTLPRQGMQIIAQTDSSGEPVTLFFIGGTAIKTSTQATIKSLLAQGRLPADALDLVQMRMFDQPPSLPKLTGHIIEESEAIKNDFSDYLESYSWIWPESERSLIAANQYAKRNNLDPILVERSMYLPSAPLASSTYAAELSPNRYLLMGPVGGMIWDLNLGEAEALQLPSRAPAHQVKLNYTTHQVEEDLGVKVISNQSTMKWQFSSSQFTALPDGTVLITGGMSGYSTFRERVGTGGTAAQNLAHASRAWGGSMLLGMGIVGGAGFLGAPILGAVSFALGALVLAIDVMTALASLSQDPNNAPGYKTRTYALTVVSNWRFMPDPYPNEPVNSDADDGQVQRDSNQEGDLLAPPKEMLAPSKPAPDQQVAGKNSGYKLELTFDKSQLNPYSGATITGTVKLVDAAGRVVPSDGGVKLQVGAGTSKLTLNEDQSGGYFSASEKHSVLTTMPPQYSGLVSGFNDPWATPSYPTQSRSASNGYVIKGASSVQVAFPGDSPWQSSDDSGEMILIDSAQVPSQNRTYLTGSTVVLKNGVGTFTYQTTGHKYDNVTFVATGQEQPVFASRNPKYTGTQLYVNNDPNRPVGCSGGIGVCASLEPMDVRNERLSNPVGYQIVPDGTARVLKKDVPNSTPNVTGAKSEPAIDVTLIAAVKTVKFADYQDATPVAVNPEIVSKVGYYYDVTANTPLNPKKGDKFTVTIQAKAKDGQSLPADVYDGLELEIMPSYRVYNRNYKVCNDGRCTTGNFINTYSAFFAEDSEINKSVRGGWLAPMGEFKEIHLSASKDPIILELEYTGEPSQTNALSFNLIVRDSRAVPVSSRFKSSGGVPLPYDIGKQIKQTMREVIPLKFAR